VAGRLHMDVSGETGASKVESRGITQATFMPSTMNAVRIHGRGGPEFLLIDLNAPTPREKPAQCGARAVLFIVEPSRKILTELAALIDNSAVNPIVSCTYPWMDARNAFGPRGRARRRAE